MLPHNSKPVSLDFIRSYEDRKKVYNKLLKTVHNMYDSNSESTFLYIASLMNLILIH